MNAIRTVLCAAFFAGFSSLPGGAFAAAPADLEAPAAPEFQLNTVLVVHNWILCVTQGGAERIARAREESVAAGEAAYAELAAEKACGRFKKLGVLLKETLYRTSAGAAHAARVFSAQVNIGVGWQDAFVVTGEASQE